MNYYINQGTWIFKTPYRFDPTQIQVPLDFQIRFVLSSEVILDYNLSYVQTSR